MRIELRLQLVFLKVLYSYISVDYRMGDMFMVILCLVPPLRI